MCRRTTKHRATYKDTETYLYIGHIISLNDRTAIRGLQFARRQEQKAGPCASAPQGCNFVNKIAHKNILL